MRRRHGLGPIGLEPGPVAGANSTSRHGPLHFHMERKPEEAFKQGVTRRNIGDASEGRSAGSIASALAACAANEPPRLAMRRLRPAHDPGCWLRRRTFSDLI